MPLSTNCAYCPVFNNENCVTYDLVVDALMQVAIKVSALRKTGEFSISLYIIYYYPFDYLHVFIYSLFEILELRALKTCFNKAYYSCNRTPALQSSRIDMRR